MLVEVMIATKGIPYRHLWRPWKSAAAKMNSYRIWLPRIGRLTWLVLWFYFLLHRIESRDFCWADRDYSANRLSPKIGKLRFVKSLRAHQTAQLECKAASIRISLFPWFGIDWLHHVRVVFRAIDCCMRSYVCGSSPDNHTGVRIFQPLGADATRLI